MAHLDYLKSVYEFKGKSVVDVGAGDGVYSRQLDQAGALVSAVEIDPDKVSRAKVNLPPRVSVMLGKAEELPLNDQSQDLICFFFSLHHVPADRQDDALVEVRRVLKPKGRLHVVEPFPYGSMFDVVRMVEDETVVRTNSQALLNRLGTQDGFNLVAKKEYILTREFPTFDFFMEGIVRSDSNRLAKYTRVAEKIRMKFEQAIEEVDGASVLHQPCAAYHFSVEG